MFSITPLFCAYLLSFPGDLAVESSHPKRCKIVPGVEHGLQVPSHALQHQMLRCPSFCLSCQALTTAPGGPHAEPHLKTLAVPALKQNENDISARVWYFKCKDWAMAEQGRRQTMQTSCK